MELKRLHTDFSVCKVEDYSLIDTQDEYCFIGKTDEENSLVCKNENVPNVMLYVMYIASAILYELIFGIYLSLIHKKYVRKEYQLA